MLQFVFGFLDELPELLAFFFLAFSFVLEEWGFTFECALALLGVCVFFVEFGFGALELSAFFVGFFDAVSDVLFELLSFWDIAAWLGEEGAEST
jgi:hypothetical protein